MWLNLICTISPGDIKMREIISTGQEIRKYKVLKDLNTYFRAVPENSTFDYFKKIPKYQKSKQ